MAQKKKIELFINVNSDKEFHNILNKNMDSLICAEIYNEFSGSCTALDHLFTKIKLDWSDGKIILLKALADEIKVLKRFLGKSEPMYIFIHRNKITKLHRGVNAVKLAEIARKELEYHKRTLAGEEIQRQTFDLDEATPEELEWDEERRKEHEIETKAFESFRSVQQELRKRRRAELMVPHLQNLNFVLFWPHSKHAHFELYERWDMNIYTSRLVPLSPKSSSDDGIHEELKELLKNSRETYSDFSIFGNKPSICIQKVAFGEMELVQKTTDGHPKTGGDIIMVGREELQLDEYKARDILYAGDAPINEASMASLLSGPALAICFRCLDDDVHFTSLVRKILYEHIEPLDPAKPMSDQPIQKTAFNYYTSHSLTREQIWQKRREDMKKQKEEAIENRARRLSEMRRLAQQAIEQVLESRRLAKEQEKLHLLKIGDLDGLEKLKAEPDNEETDIVVPEELNDDDEDLDEDIVEDENEYFPPSGLLIPGFYSPPNDVAKANGLDILFPKLVLERVIPEPEFLPPHAVVMLEIRKRYKAIAAVAPYKQAVIHMGIFKATGPSDAVHIAYSVAQYDEIRDQFDDEAVMIAFMLSTTSDLALLELMDLVPQHVSRDARAGEIEATRLFPVYYCDAREFEDLVPCANA